MFLTSPNSPQVSDLLRELLSTRYDPLTHWTSVHRVHGGHAPYTLPNELSASFTIPHDPDSADNISASTIITHYLAKSFEPAVAWLIDPPTFHIEVKTTAEGRGAEFSLSNEEFERARAYMASGSERPRDMVLLVRVFNVGEKQGMDFFPDLWSWIEFGGVGVRAVHEFRGRVRVEGE